MHGSPGTAGGALFSSPEPCLALCSQPGLRGEPHWKPWRRAHPPAPSHRCPTKVSAAPARVLATPLSAVCSFLLAVPAITCANGPVGLE